jgi:hypothetical protein
MQDSYGEVIQGRFGAVKEKIDNSMYCVKGSIKSGCFYYFITTNLIDIRTGVLCFGYYERGQYVYVRYASGVTAIVEKNNLKLISKND